MRIPSAHLPFPIRRLPPGKCFRFPIAASLLIPILAGVSLGGEEVPAGQEASGSDSRPRVQVIRVYDGKIELGGMIDPWMATFVGKQIAEAKEREVDCIVVEIDTFGGRMDAMLQIAEHICDAEPVRTIAFVKNKAWSAGGFVALACDEIYMGAGASIGSAQPVMQDREGKLIPAGEKMTSAGTAAFRSLAERKGHNKVLAAAMVDADVEVVLVEINGEKRCVTRDEYERLAAEAINSGQEAELIKVVSPSGKLLNLTAKEAVEYGFAKGVVSNLADVLATAGFEDAVLVKREAGSLQEVSRILSGPMISGLLVAMGSVAALLALYSASGTLALVAAFFYGVFFWTQIFGGSASSLEVAMFLVGVLLLAVEMFAIPGFGVFGIAGVVLIALSLISAMLPPGFIEGVGGAERGIGEWRWDAGTRTITSISVGIIACAVGLIVGMKLLPRAPLLSRLVLPPGIFGGRPMEVAVSKQEERAKLMVGTIGAAHTMLRPSGKGMFGDKLVDIVTDGRLVEKGTKIKIVEVSGNRIVVVPVEEGSA